MASRVACVFARSLNAAITALEQGVAPLLQENRSILSFAPIMGPRRQKANESGDQKLNHNLRGVAFDDRHRRGG